MSLQVEEPGRSAPSPRRRRTVMIALVVTAALGSGVAVAAMTARSDHAPAGTRLPSDSRPRPTAAADTTPDATELRVQALQALLETRSRAVLDGDLGAWLATVDPRSTTFRTEQSRVFTNLRAVPFSDWSYAYAGVAAGPSAQRVRELGGTAAWVARVQAGYRLRGYDTGSSLTEQFVTVVERDGRWYVASTSDGATAPQPWDLGRVRVVKGSHVLALGTASTATLREFALAGDRAVGSITRIWGRDWPRHAVLVVPRTEKEMGQLLQRPPHGLSQIAAVTTGELAQGDHGVARSDRVVINPDAFRRLGDSGRRVVMGHEMTHIAVRSSTTAPVPIWLSEGFADYVGYQDVDLSRRTIAADVLALVRRGKGPRELPGVDDFDPTRTTIAPAYSGAWLACRLIADRYGQAALVRLYRTVATTPVTGDHPDPDAAVQAAFEKVLGTSVAEFTAAWRDDMRALAGS